MKQLFIALAFALTTNSFGQIKVQEVYLFTETSDPNFCNPDSLFEGGCSGGYMYLTANGNVVYELMCTDLSSTTQYIGTYTMTATELVCKFNKSFSSKPGSAIKNDKAWKISLPKTACEAYPYKVSQINRKSLGLDIGAMEKPKGIVYWKADTEKSKEIIDGINKTKALKKL